MEIYCCIMLFHLTLLYKKLIKGFYFNSYNINFKALENKNIYKNILN